MRSVLAAGAAIECGYDAKAIVPALEAALRIGSEDWLAMARAAHGLATGPFASQTIAARWSEAYLRAIDLGGGQ